MAVIADGETKCLKRLLDRDIEGLSNNSDGSLLSKRQKEKASKGLGKGRGKMSIAEDGYFPVITDNDQISGQRVVHSYCCKTCDKCFRTEQVSVFPHFNDLFSRNTVERELEHMSIRFIY